MSPQENLLQRRADFHRAIDILLDHLSGDDAEELASLLKDSVFTLPNEEVSIETQHETIDYVLSRAPGAEQAAVVARSLMIEGLSLPTFHYIRALRETAQEVGKELGEAYLLEADEINFAMHFFMKTISNHLLRKRQG